MKLAINYSHQAAALLQAGQIELDYFKCPDWPGLAAEARQYCPVAIHFGLSAGSGKAAQTDWAHIEQMLHEYEVPYVNLHLHASLSDYPGFSCDTPEPAQFDQVSENLQRDVETFTAYFGPERVIIENVPYYLEGECLRPSVEPQVICAILQATGCGLLLDISHARIAADTLGIDPQAYLRSLPVGAIREMHFTGLQLLEGRLQDHVAAIDSDWEWLDWVFEQVQAGAWGRPWLLAFEYGGVGEKFAWRSQESVIADQLPRLHARVKALNGY